MADPAAELVHGTAVAVEGRAILIIGAPGAGKSTLALDMISRGAVLVADDRVAVDPRGAGGLLLTAPTALAGMIEARGVGLLEMPHAPARLAAVVDLDTVEVERLPRAHDTVIAGEPVTLLRKVESPAFAAMLVAYLKGGRREP